MSKNGVLNSLGYWKSELKKDRPGASGPWIDRNAKEIMANHGFATNSKFRSFPHYLAWARCFCDKLHHNPSDYMDIYEFFIHKRPQATVFKIRNNEHINNWFFLLDADLDVNKTVFMRNNNKLTNIDKVFEKELKECMWTYISMANIKIKKSKRSPDVQPMKMVSVPQFLITNSKKETKKTAYLLPPYKFLSKFTNTNLSDTMLESYILSKFYNIQSSLTSNNKG